MVIAAEEPAVVSDRFPKTALRITASSSHLKSSILRLNHSWKLVLGAWDAAIAFPPPRLVSDILGIAANSASSGNRMTNLCWLKQHLAEEWLSFSNEPLIVRG